MNRLRIGVIGTGMIAETAHIPAYLSHPDQVELVALCNIHPQKARRLGDRFNIPGIYGDYRDMIRQENLDAVSVCVPNCYHAPITVDCLKAGCHVLCEKPPAMNTQETEHMIQTAREQGKILTFNLHYRHSKSVQLIKRMAEQGAFGQIYAARVQALRRRGIPGWGRFTRKEIQGGGCLIDIGVHMLDVALYAMGFPDVEYAAASTFSKIGTRLGVGLMGPWDPDQFDVEDAAFGMIRFQDGSCLHLESAFALNMKEPTIMQVHLFGDRAGATVFPPRIFSEAEYELTDTDFPHLETGHDRHGSITDFIHCCIHGVQPLVRVDEALATQKILDMMYQSAQSGKPVFA